MNRSTIDNVQRSWRTFLQFLAGIVTGQVAIQVWENYISSHDVDPTLSLAITLVLGSLATFIQNQTEDATGKELPFARSPSDRKEGDIVQGDGLGAK